jgi:hypothetical protein
LVFEQFGAEDGLFRLRVKSADGYFKQGFPLNVGSDGKIDVKVVQRLLDSRRIDTVKLQEEVLRRGPGVPCYRYEPLKAEAAGTQVVATAELQSCKPEGDGAVAR